MKIFVDTANLTEIIEAQKLGLADGVTTNPSLLAKEKEDRTTIIKNISIVMEGPLHVEVTSENALGMVEEAKLLNTLGTNIFIKIPITEEGLRAVNLLKKEDIKTNVTLVFSEAQAILAIKAGASCVCPFLGRLDDLSQNGLDLLFSIREIQLQNPDLDFQIIAASIRSPLHVVELAKMGIDILTIPAKVLKQMALHPLTDIGIEQFRNASNG